jgi:hypothetical protein
MHDPNIVAFEIKSPLRSRPSELWPKGCRNSLLTIWHKDPERKGDDDSCGWGYPNLTDSQLKTLKNLAWSEAHDPWFQQHGARRIGVEDLAWADPLMRGAVQLVARALGVRASWGEICAWASRFVNNPMDNFRGGLCHLPGYHTNFPDDREDWRQDTALGLYVGIAHHILRDRRPWWRHPRWHVHHWRFQLHPLQHFLRWAFTRCKVCGGRFKWGETGVGTWSNPGPRWFRSEDLTHMDCESARVRASVAAEAESYPEHRDW